MLVRSDAAKTRSLGVRNPGDTAFAGVERLDDASLIARIGRGDQGAFRVFAGRHARRSLALAARITGDGGDAEEIVQDALLRVWQHAASWREGRAQVGTWLYRIVLNLALDRLRRRRPRSVALEKADAAPDPAPSAETTLAAAELQALVETAIAALPARQKAALTLCFQHGLTCAEAARVMQVSVSAMEALLIRARRTVRERLDSGDAAARTPVHAARREPARDGACEAHAPLDRSLALLAGPAD